MNKARKSKHKFSLLLTIVLFILLCVAVFAAGKGIHNKKQENPEDQPTVEANTISDSNGVSQPEAEKKHTEGVTPLSTDNDGEFQRVYVNLSPVEPEIAHSWGTAETQDNGDTVHYDFLFTEDGESFGIASPAALSDDDTSPDLAETINAAYDEETQTFTMECACHISGDEPFDLTLTMSRITWIADEKIYDSELIRTFGTITVYPTANNVKSVQFETPYPFENAVTGGKGEVIGAELGRYSIDILATHDNMETMYSTDKAALQAEEQQSWLQATDQLAQNMVLTFSDGTTTTGFGVLRCSYENGMVVVHCGLGNESINIDEVSLISIGDTIVWKG